MYLSNRAKENIFIICEVNLSPRFSKTGQRLMIIFITSFTNSFILNQIKLFFSSVRRFFCCSMGNCCSSGGGGGGRTQHPYNPPVDPPGHAKHQEAGPVQSRSHPNKYDEPPHSPHKNSSKLAVTTMLRLKTHRSFGILYFYIVRYQGNSKKTRRIT